jgi:hypothetical protein
VRARLILTIGALGVCLGLCLPDVAQASSGIPTDDGYPMEPERGILVLTNAARQDPQVWCAHCNDDCGAYPTSPRAPYLYDARLGRGARFHAKHIHDAPCFQHASCCELEIVDGEVRCSAPPDPACTQCGLTDCAGTPFGTRIGMFGYPTNTGAAENIAAGNARVEDTICQWLRSPGHRNNVFGGLRALGPGYFRQGSCYTTYWVQKFGGAADAIPPIPAGSRIDGSWYAVNFLSPAEPDPRTAVVVEDGRCRNLQLEWGDVASGTWTYGPAVQGGGCHTYWFHFEDADGGVHVYPTSGALGFGGAECPAWVASRPDADCLEPGDDPPGDDPPGDDPPGDDPPGDDPPGDDPPGDDPPGDDPPGDDPPGDDPPGDDPPGDDPSAGPDGDDDDAGGGGGFGRDLWAPLGGCTAAGPAAGMEAGAAALLALLIAGRLLTRSRRRLSRRGARPSAAP